MKKFIYLAIIAMALTACTGKKVENGHWASDEYKIYNVIPSYYFLDVKDNQVTQSVYIKDPNDPASTMYTIWQGKVEERTESERGIEILVRYNEVKHFRKDTVIEPKDVSTEDKVAKYLIANDTLHSMRMNVTFTKCRNIPTSEDYLSGKFSK